MAITSSFQLFTSRSLAGWSGEAMPKQAPTNFRCSEPDSPTTTRCTWDEVPRREILVIHVVFRWRLCKVVFTSNRTTYFFAGQAGRVQDPVLGERGWREFYARAGCSLRQYIRANFPAETFLKHRITNSSQEYALRVGTIRECGAYHARG